MSGAMRIAASGRPTMRSVARCSGGGNELYAYRNGRGPAFPRSASSTADWNPSRCSSRQMTAKMARPSVSTMRWVPARFSAPSVSFACDSSASARFSRRTSRVTSRLRAASSRRSASASRRPDVWRASAW